MTYANIPPSNVPAAQSHRVRAQAAALLTGLCLAKLMVPLELTMVAVALPSVERELRFGMSSGPIPPVEVGILQSKGSLFLTRPSVFHYMAEPSDLLAASAELFGLIEAAVISPPINHRFPLEAAAEAHRALETRKTMGAVVLMKGQQHVS